MTHNDTHDHTHEHDHSHSAGAAGAPAEHQHHHSAAGAADEITECPVMPGSTVNKADAVAAGLYRDHEGTRYYFCCAACPPRWDADPAKYIAA